MLEDIEVVKKLISYLKQERTKLSNTQKYSKAAATLEQIAEKRKQLRKQNDELAIIQAKEAKSKAYLNKKSAGSLMMSKPNKTVSEKKDQGSIASFLMQGKDTCEEKKESTTSTCTSLEEPSLECSTINQDSTNVDKEKEPNQSKSCFLWGIAPHHAGQ